VEPLLRRYKNILKTDLRDASLRARHAVDVSGILREIERWLAEARVAASVHAHAHMSVFAPSLSYRGRNAGESVVAAVGDSSDDDDGDDEEPEPRDLALDKLYSAMHCS
jgi:hypothetical protein